MCLIISQATGFLQNGGTEFANRISMKRPLLVIFESEEFWQRLLLRNARIFDIVLYVPKDGEEAERSCLGEPGRPVMLWIAENRWQRLQKRLDRVLARLAAPPVKSFLVVPLPLENLLRQSYPQLAFQPVSLASSIDSFDDFCWKLVLGAHQNLGSVFHRRLAHQKSLSPIQFLCDAEGWIICGSTRFFEEFGLWNFSRASQRIQQHLTPGQEEAFLDHLHHVTRFHYRTARFEFLARDEAVTSYIFFSYAVRSDPTPVIRSVLTPLQSTAPVTGLGVELKSGMSWDGEVSATNSIP
jgi:hypothetical protein